MTRLRRMMLEELQRRNHSEITTRKYLRVVSDFLSILAGPPTSSVPTNFAPIKPYLLPERKVTPGTAVNGVAALRFFFVKTLQPQPFHPAVQIEHSAQLPDVDQQGVGTKLLRIQTHL